VYFIIVVSDVNIYIYIYLTHNGMASVKLHVLV